VKLRGWLLGAVSAVGSTAAIVGYASSRPAARVPYETVRVERMPIAARVAATGTLSARVTVQVGSQISGRIQELHADFNSRVKKGQVLAKIDGQLLQAALAQARAALEGALGHLAKARAAETNAKLKLARTRTLADSHLVAGADLEQAQADADAATAEVAVAAGEIAQMRASVLEAEVNLGYATILSPVDGIVISRNVDVGQTVAASLQAPTLFTLAGDPAQMQVDTTVAEADVGKLSAGMAARFTVDAYPSAAFKGVVREVRIAPQTLQGVVTYDVVLDVDNADLRLKPGMTAHVSFTVAERADALCVPNAALRYRPPSESRSPGRRRLAQRSSADTFGATDERTVWRVVKGVASPVSVKVGFSDGASTEVLGDALRPGEQVIVGAAETSENPDHPVRLF
jgi:HlyD family secretion protein